MQRLAKSIGVGAASGALTAYASIWTLGYTMAIAMPQSFPIGLWDALVVVGLGAALVALVVHLVAVRLVATSAAPTLLGFVAGIALTLLLLGEALVAPKAWAAWILGALIAHGIGARLGSNNTLKGTPLRGTP